MIAGAETIHVVFGCSIADTLRSALPLLGCTDRVIGLPNVLSVGPIDPPDPNLRRAWAQSVLRTNFAARDDSDNEPTDPDRAWAEATAPGIHPVFWVCFTSPAEHACFLAFAARMRDRPFDVIDATALDFTTVGGIKSPPSLAMMRPQDIVASGLFAMRRPVFLEECRAATQAWSRLQHENAPFRVVRDGRLVSASLTHYDALLIEQASHEWEVAIRLIGRAVTTFETAPHGDSTGDDVLFGRMLALGEAGALEVAGPGPGMRDLQVRRASAKNDR